MKVLLIIPDGLGDRPAEELEGKTPLEAANSPNLDMLADAGMSGQYTVFAPGIPVGSPIALHVMMGYPVDEFPDRGVLISVARGLETSYEDVVLAARFASVAHGEGQLRLLSRFIRDEEEACKALAASIDHFQTDGLTFRYQYHSKGDGILFISGDASSDVTDSDPLGLDLPVIKVQPMEKSRYPIGARRTAVALNQFLSWAHREMCNHSISSQREKLGKTPINFLITKWSGQRRIFESFSERTAFKAASMPDEEVVKGLVIEMGMKLVDIPRAIGPEENIRQRLLKAEELFSQGYDFIHLHTKEPDYISHWCNPLKTKEALESWDRGFARYWEALGKDEDLLTVFTSDHSTPSQWDGMKPGDFNDQHSGEPCPLIIKGRHVRRDSIDKVGERFAAKGGLGLVRGSELMNIMLSLTDRTNLYGMRPTPKVYRYRPREVEPFNILPE